MNPAAAAAAAAAAAPRQQILIDSETRGALFTSHYRKLIDISIQNSYPVSNLYQEVKVTLILACSTELVKYYICSEVGNTGGSLFTSISGSFLASAPSRISAPIIRGDTPIRHYYGY